MPLRDGSPQNDNDSGSLDGLVLAFLAEEDAEERDYLLMELAAHGETQVALPWRTMVRFQCRTLAHYWNHQRGRGRPRIGKIRR